MGSALEKSRGHFATEGRVAIVAGVLSLATAGVIFDATSIHSQETADRIRNITGVERSITAQDLKDLRSIAVIPLVAGALFTTLGVGLVGNRGYEEHARQVAANRDARRAEVKETEARMLALYLKKKEEDLSRLGTGTLLKMIVSGKASSGKVKGGKELKPGKKLMPQK